MTGMSKFLIVGLGNIGSEYAQTRHNIGFDIVDALVKKYEGNFRADRLADVAEIKIKGKQLVCIKPTTYMNLSGKAVKYWRDKENIPVENLLVVVDDLALPLRVQVQINLVDQNYRPSITERIVGRWVELREPSGQVERDTESAAFSVGELPDIKLNFSLSDRE